MKIYYDENMPFVDKLFSRFGDVIPFAGRACNSELIADADVLLVRSITRIDHELLIAAKQLKFVGTATIGTDHVDQAYLSDREIAFAAAPGCNAISVAEYVLSAIKVLEQKYFFSLHDKTVGIVGAGNTGSRLSEKLDALGVKYLLCDPPLARSGDVRRFVDYQTLLQQSDIISFHVPLIDQGEYSTKHMFAAEQLAMVKADAVIINACRGEVLDSKMLLSAKQQGLQNPLVFDVWEGEPNVLVELLPFVDIATAHIAGYSFEGKARGSFMLYQALCRLLNQKPTQVFDQLMPISEITELNLDMAGCQAGEDGLDGQLINRIIHLVYDVRRDDALFRQHILRQGFDWIRRNYPVRREFSALTVFGQQHLTLDTLIKLGFKRGESHDATV